MKQKYSLSSLRQTRMYGLSLSYLIYFIHAVQSNLNISLEKMKVDVVKVFDLV